MSVAQSKERNRSYVLNCEVEAVRVVVAIPLRIEYGRLATKCATIT